MVEIKFGEYVEYVPKNEGMQLKCEDIGPVVSEGLEDLSQVNHCSQYLSFLVEFLIDCKLMVFYLFGGFSRKF